MELTEEIMMRESYHELQCALGMTDKEIAEATGIALRTLKRLRFCEIAFKDEYYNKIIELKPKNIYKIDDFFEFLRVWRIRNDITNKEMSSRLGISSGHYSTLEGGSRAVTVRQYKQLVDVMGMTKPEFNHLTSLFLKHNGVIYNA